MWAAASFCHHGARGLDFVVVHSDAGVSALRQPTLSVRRRFKPQRPCLIGHLKQKVVGPQCQDSELGVVQVPGQPHLFVNIYLLDPEPSWPLCKPCPQILISPAFQ